MLGKILKLIKNNNQISQRKIAEILDISVGSVNRYIKILLEEKYLEKEILSYRETKYNFLEKGYEVLKEIENKKMTGIILTAGENKEFNKSIGMLEIYEKETIIDRQIKILLKNGIKDIVLVVGYYKEKYKELIKKYLNINIIFVENMDFKNTGNMHSLFLTRKIIKNDIFLLEGDLIYEEKIIEELLLKKEKNISVATELKKELNDNLYVDFYNNKLRNLSKDKFSLKSISGELVGITKISYENYLKMIKKYIEIKNELYFYEYSFIDKDVFLEMNILYKKNLIWGEVDTKEQYKQIKKDIVPKIFGGKNESSNFSSRNGD